MGILAALAIVAALTEPQVPQVTPQGMLTLDLHAPDVADVGITALRDKYAAAVNAGDAAALGALYAPDALVVVADGVVLRGAQDVARYFQDAIAARAEGAAVTLRPERFSIDGGVASETGTFSESRAGDAGSPPDATGVYVTIYTRDGAGGWRIAMEVRTRGRDKQLVRW